MKRFIDVIVSLSVLIVFFPVLTLTAVLIRISMGKPVLFKQERPGLNGQPFCLYKLRTMQTVRDQKGEMLDDEWRITRLGRIIRSLSIDELPQLINVLKGDMSLIGPRPLLLEYLPLYTKEQKKRHLVKPGITGWAQINGRNAITWEEKFKLDVWYVENRSLKLDMKIFLLTLKKIIKKEGISQQGQVTMEKFKGPKEGV